MTRHTYTTTLSFGSEDDHTYCELEVTVSYTVAWGRPATGPTYACGGTPADPDEINDLTVETVDGKPRPWDRGYGFISDDQLAEMIVERLIESDRDYDAMLAQATEHEYEAREYAAEMRAEARWERAQ